jgi:hypothetical protein
MWRVIEFSMIAIIVLIFITEIFIPVMIDKPLFRSFRKVKDDDNNNNSPDDLSQKISKAKKKVKDVKATQEEVNEYFNNAQQIKDKADKLFN